MAVGQIDPARLDGDALTNWYLRSPTDIERERQDAANRAYDDFFGNSERETLPQKHPDERLPLGNLDGQPRGSYQLASATGGLWSVIPYCANCHGGQPGAVPPAGGVSPFPPFFSPRTGGFGGQSPEPHRDLYPQCEMQERSDRNICYQQPTPPAKAVCNESATRRRVFCEDNKGELGSPDLFTAKRKSGAPWP